MIRRYVYGNVIETEAVLNKPEQENGALPYFTVDEQAMTLSYTVDEVDFDHPECIGFVESVKDFNTITIFRHVFADMDAIGSQFGLKYY